MGLLVVPASAGFCAPTGRDLEHTFESLHLQTAPNETSPKTFTRTAPMNRLGDITRFMGRLLSTSLKPSATRRSNLGRVPAAQIGQT
jgi:hypothetical protein